VNDIIIYKRNCPKCNKEIFYKREQYLTQAIKNNSTCLICRSKARAKKSLESRIKNGTLHFNNAYKAWETRRNNGKPWHSNETRLNQRIAAIKRIAELGNESVGKHETKILNDQENIDNCKILRQHRVWYGPDKFYKVDGYCKETNTVYEVYESFHKNQIKEDLQRQKMIEEKLNCKFIIIQDTVQE